MHVPLIVRPCTVPLKCHVAENRTLELDMPPREGPRVGGGTQIELRTSKRSRDYTVILGEDEDDLGRASSCGGHHYEFRNTFSSTGDLRAEDPRASAEQGGKKHQEENLLFHLIVTLLLLSDGRQAEAIVPLFMVLGTICQCSSIYLD